MGKFYNDSRSEGGCYYPEDLNDDNNKENYVPSSFSVPLNNRQLNLTDMAEIDSFIEQQCSENATKKTTYNLNIWQHFCSSRNEGRKIRFT